MAAACAAPQPARPRLRLRAPHPAPTHPSIAPCRCLQAYFSYSLIILSITLFSILSTVLSTYAYRRRLAALAHYTCEVKLLQGGRVVTVSSTELVPGALPAGGAAASPTCTLPAWRRT